jgi:Tol biopolymer transport system component
VPEPSSSGAPSIQAEDRLDSWKEIAAYLDRDVTTVQRWEKREAMPVHRHLHDRIGSVYASRAELDAWARSRNRLAVEDQDHAGTPSALLIQPPRDSSRRARKLVVTLAVVVIAFVVGLALWLQRTEYFWRSPIANAQFQPVTEFEGTEQATTISRDGHFIAFLSDRDGQTDVWVTQTGSGQFHNLTHGSAQDLVNPLIRALAFSPDSSLVTYWVRRQDGSAGGNISIWAVPTLGGEPKPYLERAGDLDWSPDGSRLVYHQPSPGDPLFVSPVNRQAEAKRIYVAPDGLHCHFPLWDSDSKFIYFVRGSPPDQLDIWRIASTGGTPERITFHNGRVTHPVLLDRRTLLYLATDSDGSGPWLYSMDVERRIPHRLSPGLDRYTSLAASGDGRHLVLTLATPKRTLWHSALVNSGAEITPPVPVSLTTNTGFSPRFGSNYLLYVSPTGAGESIWKLSNGSSTELWSSYGAQALGSPAISRDGRYIAFSVRQNGKALLYLMQPDGTQARVVTDALDLQGSPAWAADGHAILTAANDHGTPHLFRVPVDGGSPTALVQEQSLDPALSPDGNLIAYSGPDISTTFSVKAVTSSGTAYPISNLTLPRGARHLAFTNDGRSLVVLRGSIEHKDLWLFDLETGTERRLTNFHNDFNVADFDISPDGRQLILERVQQRSDVVLLNLKH